MPDLSKALAEIDAIRGQVARGTEFRGYGPATHVATGLLAIAAAIIQSRWVSNPVQNIGAFLEIWVATAVISVILIGGETISRTRRVHTGLAREMIHVAVEHLLPALLAGLLLTVVLMRSAPQSLWMLPGLWQVLFSLGVFSSCKSLPRPMFAVGVWYLSAGLFCLAAGPSDRALSGWLMGIPFGIGQVLVAAVLQFGYGASDGEAR